jgi:hypothetical protein
MPVNATGESQIQSTSPYQGINRRTGWLIVAGSVLLVIILTLVVFYLRSITAPDQPTTTSSVENEIPRWEKKAPLPIARHSLIVTAYGDYVYAISGETAYEITDNVERYDPEKDEWVSLIGKPTPVKDASAVVIGKSMFRWRVRRWFSN